MRQRGAAFLWDFINGIADVFEEKILLNFSEYKYMFWSNFVILGIGLLMGFIFGIEMTFFSFFVTILYSVSIIGGDVCYIKGIKNTTLSVANLLSSGTMFIILICDILLGYIKPNINFFILFIVYFISVFIFTRETDKMKSEITKKKIELKGVVYILISVIFYSAEPYFIKLATSKGANEFGMNILMSLIAVLFFYYQMRKIKEPKMYKEKQKSFVLNIFFISILYAIADFLYLYAFKEGTPIVISLIINLQIFVVVLFSVIAKTDKFNLIKIISLLTSVGSVILMLLIQ